MAAAARGDYKLTDYEDRAARYGSDVRLYLPGYGAMFDMAAALLSSRAPGDCNLLVVAAGGGEEFCAFGSRFPGWKMTGVDPSPAMLAVARQRVEEMGIGDRVETLCGTAGDLPEGKVFDAATCMFVMGMIQDDGSKLAFLREVAKRLKRGAPLLLADAVGDVGSEAFGRIMADVAAHGISGGMQEDEMDKFRSQVGRLPIVTEAREMELMEQAGFAVEYQYFRALIFSAWIAYKK
ncbi:unnamed protein product [Ostreobium quekettii]|uniref:Methyltransferase domain-containing protein n=1 Tax=Ostreobium quekettii TaxID=121088 RepID=A0A8S1IZ31_9CHLO|nr:unnamed protein product [Ostreobium quekettii]|eukprot:evm.model.scf_776EXC.2 EVM.evm.TU.scf_776EXC.2   scf_776EXC:17598-18305(+)